MEYSFFSSDACLFRRGTSVNTSENHEATTLFPWKFYTDGEIGRDLSLEDRVQY